MQEVPLASEGWTGGAAWQQEGEIFGVGNVTWPFAELRLNEVGGVLRSTLDRSRPHLPFVWGAVRTFERVKVLALPVLGEGVRVSLTRLPARTNSRSFIFFTVSGSRSLGVIDFARGRGVEVQRRAQYSFDYR